MFIAFHSYMIHGIGLNIFYSAWWLTVKCAVSAFCATGQQTIYRSADVSSTYVDLDETDMRSNCPGNTADAHSWWFYQRYVIFICATWEMYFHHWKIVCYVWRSLRCLFIIFVRHYNFCLGRISSVWVITCVLNANRW